MKLEKQVTSLELSKKLKELGVKQESTFRWSAESWPELPPVLIYEKQRGEYPSVWDLGIPAFTVAELGEMLPEGFHTDEATFHLITSKQYVGWHITYESSLDGPYEANSQIEADTEASARAKMLIYLLENNFVNP